jgi:hypothetical protein
MVSFWPTQTKKQMGCSCGVQHDAPTFLCGQVFIDKSGGKMFAERKKECLFNFEH